MRMVLGTRPWAGKERLNSSRNVKSVTEPDFRVHGQQETDNVLAALSGSRKVALSASSTEVSENQVFSACGGQS